MRPLRSLGTAGLWTFMTATAFSANPLLTDWTTPFQVPPFDAVQLDDYRPAFEEAMRVHQQEVVAISTQRAAPTFENTIAALDRSGLLLDRVNSLFSAMKSSMNNEQLEAIARDIVPALSQHEDDIKLNDLLFQRVQAVHAAREQMNLTAEQRQLLQEYYRGFVRGGANLPPARKEQLKELNARLSLLAVQFGEHVLKEENRFELVVDQPSDLAGLPPNVLAAAAVAAQERGHPSKWVFTLHKPSMIPFLQYAERRELRERIYRAYLNRGDHGDELDNKAGLAEIARLRAQRARLLGYPTHARYVLEENMAKDPARVYELLLRIWEPALRRAREEAADMQAQIDQQGGGFQLAPWDWWFYAEKVKRTKYDLDEEMLRPYFQLENVRQGAFDLATRLYGLRFEPRADLPVYHPDVSAFAVRDAAGTHVGVLYVDYFPRASKRGGAWMGEFRQQMKLAGADVRPVIYNVGNFSKPTPGHPSLLSREEVETLFHEFGHALHGLLSDCTYKTIAGTNVARDFVELPSQIMENWATEPAVLRQYARHFETNEPMPDELIQKIRRARHFNQGFATTEYLAAAFLDLDWHTRIEPDQEVDVPAFEQDSLRRIGLIPEILPRYRSTYFNHIFSGGYSAGYYAYIWAEVLAADAFQAFQETGDIFNPQVARAFQEQILSRGATEEPMELYRRFRGREPSIDPLLARRGLNH